MDGCRETMIHFSPRCATRTKLKFPTKEAFEMFEMSFELPQEEGETEGFFLSRVRGEETGVDLPVDRVPRGEG